MFVHSSFYSAVYLHWLYPNYSFHTVVLCHSLFVKLLRFLPLFRYPIFMDVVDSLSLLSSDFDWTGKFHICTSADNMPLVFYFPIVFLKFFHYVKAVSFVLDTNSYIIDDKVSTHDLYVSKDLHFPFQNQSFQNFLWMLALAHVCIFAKYVYVHVCVCITY